MKNLKRILSVFLLLVLVTTSFNFMASAPRLIVDGKRVAFSDNLGYPYVDSSNRTMVPFEAAVEAAGATTGWDASKKTAIIITDDTRVEIPIGTNFLYVNGQKVVNDTKSVTISGRTYLPIKAVFEAIGYKISWDSATRAVIAKVDVNFITLNYDKFDRNDPNKAIYGSSGLNYSKSASTISYLGNTYNIIEVEGGNLSGSRQANVAVDIGFGDREYWGLTNKYGQLVYVLANEIILQDPNIEPVLSSGRYYSDEAKVPGTERTDLDEGHVIADSLGGVSNAYNITPQNSVLNQNGDQAYMEKWIRDALGCTNFTAAISYPDTSTQIPNHYSFTYTLKGEVVHDEFDNASPDGVFNTENNSSLNETNSALNGSVIISKLDKKAEYIILKNITSQTIDLTGWKIRSVRGDQWFTFPSFKLEPNSSVKVGDLGVNNDIDFHWLDGRGTWNNSDSDPAEVYDQNSKLIDSLIN